MDCRQTFRRDSAFTLLELLLVIGVLVLMTALMVPAFNSMRGGTDFTSMVFNLSSFLDQARAYAMGNNTYVYVGFEETNVSTMSSSVQTAATATVGGRIGVSAIASNDGTSQLAPASGTLVFSQLGKLQHFDNIHIAGPSFISGTSSAMTRPSGGVVNLYNITNGVPLFNYPLAGVSVLTPGLPGTPQFNFYNQCIQFDPQGVPRMVAVTSGTATTSMVQYIEIDLQQSHGNTVPTAEPPQEAAIQIDGMTGVNRIYRQ